MSLLTSYAPPGVYTMKPTTVADINTLGDRVLRFLGVKHVNIFGINLDGTENEQDLYLRRYYVYRGKHRPHIYLHHIVRSDYERACHDHPWDFVSLLLTGKYREHLAQVTFFENGEELAVGKILPTSRVRRAGAIVIHSCYDLHRLELEKPMWTLVFTGHRKRDWGFQTPDKGWIKWNTLYQYIKDMME